MDYTINYQNYKIPVLYEDNHVIVAVKPHGILSQSDISGVEDILSIIKSDIKIRYNKPGNVFLGLIHRLDRNTGGTMIFAKTSKGASRLSEQLRKKKMIKGYFAIVHGVPTQKKGFLYNKLEKNEKDNIVRESKNGKECVLYYECIESKEGISLIFAVPITGRTHQIRVQMSLAGYPLAGDVKYGSKNMTDIHRMKKHELALWSSVISIKHPTEDRIIKAYSIPSSGIWDMFEQSEYKEFSESVLNERFCEFEKIKSGSK